MCDRLREACAEVSKKRKVSDDQTLYGCAKRSSRNAMRRDRSYGYRRSRIFLGRDGHHMGPERAHRLWRAAGLRLPRRRPRTLFQLLRSVINAVCTKHFHQCRESPP